MLTTSTLTVPGFPPQRHWRLFQAATRRYLTVAVLAAVAALLLSACGAEPSEVVVEPDEPAEETDEPGEDEVEPERDAGLVPVTLRLNFAADLHHAPMHLAYEQGYYEEQGLNMRVLDGTGSSETITLVGAGADTFGLTSLPVMAIAVEGEGVPVRAIAGHIQIDPIGVFSLGERGIETPQDLDGTVAGWTPGSFASVLFPAFAEAADVDPDFERATMDAGAVTTALLRGDVDWITRFGITQIPIFEEDGIDYNFIPYSDYISVLGLGFIVSLDIVESDPDLVRGFVQATMRGFQDAIDDPVSAADAMVKHRPAMAGREQAIARSIELWADHIQTPRSKDRPLGWMHPDDWMDTVEVLQQYMDMGELDDVGALFTNEFIDGQ